MKVCRGDCRQQRPERGAVQPYVREHLVQIHAAYTLVEQVGQSAPRCTPLSQCPYRDLPPLTSTYTDTIPCNTMQYHAIPYNTIRYHTIPCNTMQYHATSHSEQHTTIRTLQEHTMPRTYNAMQHHATRCHTTLHNTIQYHTMPYNALPYDTSKLLVRAGRGLQRLAVDASARR